MRRGEIWWADLPAPAGRRPVVLLSRNAAYRVRALVTIAPLTTRVRSIASEVAIGREEGLPKAGAANLDSITTIPKRALTTRIAMLPPHKLEALEHALHFSLGLGCGRPAL